MERAGAPVADNAQVAQLEGIMVVGHRATAVRHAS
jgi:hypothetical protein